MFIYTQQLANMIAAGLYGTFVQMGKDKPSRLMKQDANEPYF